MNFNEILYVLLSIYDKVEKKQPLLSFVCDGLNYNETGCNKINGKVEANKDRIKKKPGDGVADKE